MRLHLYAIKIKTIIFYITFILYTVIYVSFKSKFSIENAILNSKF